MKLFKSIFAVLLAILILSFCACAALQQAADQIRDIVSEMEAGDQTAGGQLSFTTAEPAVDPTADPSPVTAAGPTADPTASLTAGPSPDPSSVPAPIDENGTYTSKDDVALYIHLFGHLPKNYITKEEAQSLGWEGGSLEPYAPGCSIGGGYFGNYEELLPKKKGRTYTECDIDTRGKKSRGAKRIVFSNDGLIYYTDDHYESFTLLYGGN